MFTRLLTFAVTVLVGASHAQKSYEYIVVGSGPGGGALAANLARAGKSVLLLEAGDDQSNNVNTTVLSNFNATVNDESTRWDFWVQHTEDRARQDRYLYMTYRMPDGSFYVGTDPPAGAKRLGIWYPRTGTLGGCAMHNAGVSHLPLDEDWDHIAEITGDKTWRHEKMRKYFVKLEKNHYAPNDPGHGTNGYLDQSIPPGAWAADPASDLRIIAELHAEDTAGDKSKLPQLVVRDPNDNDPRRDKKTGIFGIVRHATPQNIRVSPNTYIRETVAEGFPLTVQLESLVTKVLFDKRKKTPRAIGVEYLRGKSLYKADPRYKDTNRGVKETVYATKEVILAGGVFNTPQVLKLSGIGPKAELRKFGIPVIKDLPGVGERMADNYENNHFALAARNITGPASLYNVMLKSSTAQNGNRDLYLWCGSFSLHGFWPGYPKNYGPAQFECAMAHMAPRSQEGYVRLTSANPQDVPLINMRYFEKGADKDLQALLDGVNWSRKILSRVPAESGLAPFQEIRPCPAGRKCTAKEEKEFLRDQVYSHHATSTAQIGSDKNRFAVLNSKFQVKGVKGLRVVDGSAFPRVPGAFPVIPTFMLAEKATEDILTGR